MKLDQDRRQELLDDAVTAVQAWIADTTPRAPAGPYMHMDETRPARRSVELREAAERAVTRAVTLGEHIHTLITSRVGCPGMRVVNLIDDRDARDRALVVEQNAAENYLSSVRGALRVAAIGRASTGYGAVSEAARVFGVTRKTIYDWADEAGEALART